MAKTYADLLGTEFRLPRRKKDAPVVLDLFAGCGGLALGFESVGFHTFGFEMDADACASYSINLRGKCEKVILAPNQDLGSKADVIIGGPPCQPFSVGGLQAGKNDARNGFPAFMSACERYRPSLIIFENVRGMMYQNRDYLNKVMRSIAALGYIVEFRILRAVDFSVPQRRERLFVVGHHGGWVWPEPHGRVFTAGDALGAMAVDVPVGAKFLNESMDRYVAKYELASKCTRPRDLHLDEPSRTVTCRNLNGATGDMLRIRLPDGRRRRLTVREGARLQGFPDWFEFAGAEGSQFNQVGNAVPPLLAKAVARCAFAYMQQAPAERGAGSQGRVVGLQEELYRG